MVVFFQVGGATPREVIKKSVLTLLLTYTLTHIHTYPIGGGRITYISYITMHAQACPTGVIRVCCMRVHWAGIFVVRHLQVVAVPGPVA